MPDVPHGPPEGQHVDIDTARARLTELIQAGEAFLAAWHPSFAVGLNPPYVGWIRDLLFTLECWEEDFAETAPIESYQVARLDLGDRGQVPRWLKELDTQIKDAVAAGEDATRPPGQRTLGRSLARKHLM